MIIDVVGPRGSGKSTFCRMMKEEHNVLTREDRDKFQIPSWKEVQKEYYGLADAFNFESERFRHYMTGVRITTPMRNRKRQEIQLWVALQKQLKDRVFVWDKGLLEVIMYFQHYGEETISYDTVKVWPFNKVVLLDSDKDYERSILRKRNKQFDSETHARFKARNRELVNLFDPLVIDNSGSEEELRRAVKRFV